MNGVVSISIRREISSHLMKIRTEVLNRWASLQNADNYIVCDICCILSITKPMGPSLQQLFVVL